MELKNQIRDFLTVHNQKLSEEMTDEFLIKTSYLADIFGPFNEANKRMQSADANVMECKETVDAFVRKVEYRMKKMATGDLQQFPLLQQQSGGKLPDALARQFTRHMEELQEEMHSRFSDVNEHVSKDAWVMDPFLAKEEDVEHLQAEDELMDIKSNSLCKRFYAEHGYKRFWLVKGPAVLLIMQPPDSSCHLPQHTCQRLHSALWSPSKQRHATGLMCKVTFVWLLPKSHQTSHHWLRKYSLRALITRQVAWTLKVCVCVCV